MYLSSPFQLEQSTQALDAAKPSYVTVDIPGSVKPPPLQPSPDLFPEALPRMNESLCDPFLHTSAADCLFAGTSLPSFASLFATYLEAHEALTAVHSGSFEFLSSNPVDSGGLLGIVTRISELAASISTSSDASTFSPFLGSEDQCCLQLALLTAVKGCELAENVFNTLLPSGTWGLTSTPSPPPFDSSGIPASPPSIDDYPWSTAPTLPSNLSKPPIEHITSLIQLDVQLSQLYSFMSKFLLSTPLGDMTLTSSLAARWQRRLSELHPRIRAAVNSMMPAWE